MPGLCDVDPAQHLEAPVLGMITCDTSQRCYLNPNSGSKHGCAAGTRESAAVAVLAFIPACFHLSLPCSPKGAVTGTSPLATGSAEFGSQNPPCGSELSPSVEAVSHLISPAFCELQGSHGEKLSLPALQAGVGELKIFSSVGWQKREMVFPDV